MQHHLDKLAAFKEIAERGKIREAAEKLNLTQPALTRMIQKLEEISGAKLFYRSRSGVLLTPAGEELLAYSKKILRDLDDLKVRLKYPKDALSGHVRIGSYETLAEYLWPDFLLHFKKQNPNLNLSIVTNSAVHHANMLLTEEIDMIIDAEPRMTGDLTSWALYEDRFHFYANKKNHFEIKKGRVQNIPLIFVPMAFDERNKKIVDHLEENGYFFEEKIELDSFTAVKTFSRKGLGVGVLPQKLYEDDMTTNNLKKIDIPGFSSKGFGAHCICASVKSNRAEDPRLRLLVKSLREWYK